MAAETGVAAAPMPPVPGSWDLLVNATSAGMHPRVDETPWPERGLRRAPRVRPGLQPARDAPAARGARGRMRDARWPGDAGRAGRAAVRDLDRPPALARRHARGRRVTPARRLPRRTLIQCRCHHETDHLRRVRGPGQARHLRAGVQGDHRRPADAGLGLPEDRRALRLRVPARKRRGRRARRPLLVPRQGPVSGRPRARRQDGDRARRDVGGVGRGLHPDRAEADGRLPRAVRAAPAALHRRRRRLSHLRRGRVVRAGAVGARAARRARHRHRPGDLHAVRHGARRSITPSTGCSSSPTRASRPTTTSRRCISSRARASSSSKRSSSAACRAASRRPAAP